MRRNIGGAREATDDNIIRRMRIACWITKAADTRSEYTGLFEMIVGVLTTCRTEYT